MSQKGQEDRYAPGRDFDGPQITEDSPAKPEWGYIAGYFYEWDADKKNSAHVAKKVVRNLDYIRLKDEFLFLVDPAPGTKILDIGCAMGSTMIYCALQGADVSGVDLSSARIETANQNFQKLGLEDRAFAQVGDATDLPYPDNHFDVVTSVDFIEHIDAETKRKNLIECYRVLKPGGRMVIKTPNMKYLKASLLFKRIRALLKLQNPFNLVIPHTTGPNPEHIGLVDRSTLEAILYKCEIRNFQFYYQPLRRSGLPRFVSLVSSEVPFVRDWLNDHLVVMARKSIILSHFP